MIVILVLLLLLVALIKIYGQEDHVGEAKPTPFDITFIGKTGMEPAAYIVSKFGKGLRIDEIQYLFERIEAEIESTFGHKSPGFDYYYAKAMTRPVMMQYTETPIPVEVPQAKGSQRHRWRIEEDALCCRRFFEEYVVQHSSVELQAFAQRLKRELPDISVGSLRKKTQNIQQLCMEFGIKSSLDAKPLSQYSQQNLRAFIQVKKEFGM